MRKKSILFILLGILIVGGAVFFAVQIVQSDSATKDIKIAKEALENEEFEKSITLFKKILKKDPPHTEARAGLANAYMGLSQFKQTIETLDEGIELKPKEPQFYYFLSVAYEGIIDLPHVIQTLEEGINATDNIALKEQMEQLKSNVTMV